MVALISLSLPCSKGLYFILKGICYLLFHSLFTRPILWPPRSKAVTYTQNNWLYLIAAAHNSSVRCLSNLSESILSLLINFPVTFFLCLFFSFLSPPPLIYYSHKFLYQSYTCPARLRILIQARLRPRHTPMKSALYGPLGPGPPGLTLQPKPAQIKTLSLSPTWAGARYSSPLSCTPVLLSPHGIVHIIKRERNMRIYIYISVRSARVLASCWATALMGYEDTLVYRVY